MLHFPSLVKYLSATTDAGVLSDAVENTYRRLREAWDAPERG